MTEKLVNQLYNKLRKEYLEYIENIKQMPIEQVISNSYSIAIRQEFVDMFYGTENYNKYELKVLLEKDNTLDFLYEDWVDAEGGIHNVLEENLSEALFSGNIKSLDKDEILMCFKNVPSFDIEDSSKLIDVLVNNNICSSRREAREFLNAGSITINDEKVKDENMLITKDIAIDNEIIVLKRGKKKNYICKIK